MPTVPTVPPNGKKIVTIGEVIVEIMAVEPGDGFRAAIPLIGPFPSGAPAIFIDQVARLGQPCGIVSRVGDDDFGALNIDRLRKDGVDVSALTVAPGETTGSAFVRYRPDGDRDFVFNIVHSACGRVADTPETRAMIATADHLHVMGSALVSDPLVAVIGQAIEQVKGHCGTVSFDPNIRKEMLGHPGMRRALDHVLDHADLFLPSGPELFLFTEAREESAAVAEILARGVQAVVVKRGAGGATYTDRAQAIHVPALPVDEIDPTGAGDSFGATFVTYWLRGASPHKALTLAKAAGARAVTVKGPMAGASTEADLLTFLSLHQVETPS